ncbi:MAG: hypothetical protein ACXWQO_01870 [Bdellovibrionota bacterium]
MKKKLSLLALAFASAAVPSAYAAPKTSSAKKVFSRNLTGESADELFSALAVPTLVSEDVSEKNFNAGADSLQIQCKKSQSAGTECKVDMPETDDQPGNYFAGAAAQALYEAVNKAVIPSTFSDVKAFTDSNEEVKIYCGHSLFPNGNPYACTVQLQQ